MVDHRKQPSKRHRQDASSNNAFTPHEIASDTSWVDLPEMEQPPGSADAYVQAYLADPDTYWWSTNDYSSSEADVVLKRVLAIIVQARLPDHKQALGQLGVGPLEDMMSDALLDLLGPWMPFTAAMCYALGSVRMEFEPPALQRRLATMILHSQGKDR
ncbi:hypothetical protein G6L94_09940 [Agrobacterium rhizogenes]|uniref:hypothetical protein n=1 Tax=Rhizobium rhizogenes TaxID=359 RepID=UPI0004D70D4F|nr:hypothetical protein [Rhizobium rhizogenes]OCJ26443.1 hypothetical protein A6U88_04745 [Agrobacterium sp. B131/95]OCJ31964.1 hypothetical protein A6U89_01740 [Agrobacterium sp. B133/95]KEA06734.1 hypothetical protein CN09_07020 [Rhizobium rhizogenes]MDJ1634619.1 hypothetical protein [Rhizobium rhizogenes]MQB29712.1 hypothetical protein [Rhizobium rhizogenes]